ALWALHAVGGCDEKALLALLASKDEPVRAWAIRLLVEDRHLPDDAAAKLTALARDESAASVRLALASALQRLPHAQRWPIAERLVTRAEDAADPNLPLMIWYGIEAAVPADTERATKLLQSSRQPALRQYIARRIAETAE